MSSVGYSGPTNSQLFTTCCKIAICDDQRKCPRCGEYVYPFNEYMTEKEKDEAGGGYYNHNTHRARHSAARGRGYL